MEKTSTSKTRQHPLIDRLFDLRDKIWSERQDLQETFPNPNGIEFWFWLMWSGAEYYREVKQALYPLPDRFLLDRVVGEFVPEKNFHTSGIVDARRMMQCLSTNGFSFSDDAAVLDFGCGCSRLLRYFSLYAHQCRFYGADVDADAVQWCVKHIDFVEFQQVSEMPPAPYPDSFFDAVYSYSVFSHFSEQLHLSWLEELHRIAKPGAKLVLTVQGTRMLEQQSPEIISKKEQSDFNGFLFVPYQQLQFHNKQNEDFYSNWNLQNYGDAFIIKPYIEKTWGGLFEIIDWLESPDGSQDYVVLRNRE